jgi:hypothetical protein
MTSLLKGLASRGGKIIISATSDLTVFADAESKIQISWNKSQNRPRHLSLFQIEQSNGVKFSVPVFSIVVNKRLRAIARGLEKGKGNPLIDFFANQNHLEAEAVLPYRGADEERTRISTILEPAKPTVMSNNISFMVMAKHISCVPSNSILNAYRTNDPCLLFWELSGVAHKNPLVPFRIIGKSSTPVT